MPGDGASQMPGMKRVSGKDAGSKIALFWDANDQVKVIVDGQSAIFTLTEGEGTISGTFTGIMPADGTSYTVTYPSALHATPYTKLLHDGQLLILRDGRYYTLTGQMVHGH